MRYRARTLAALAFFAVVSVSSDDGNKDAAEKFAESFTDPLGIRLKKPEVSPGQLDSLRKVHGLLLRVANSRSERESFWRRVRQSGSEEIDWGSAKTMILKGHITFVSQSHSLRLFLKARDGRTYTTKESEIDEVFRVVRQVDPKGVFVCCETQ